MKTIRFYINIWYFLPDNRCQLMSLLYLSDFKGEKFAFSMLICGFGYIRRLFGQTGRMTVWAGGGK